MTRMIAMEKDTSDLPEEKPSETAVSGVDWASLVEKIREDDPAGMEELYCMFSRGIRLYLCRQLGLQELDDKIHDTFLIVINAIKRMPPCPIRWASTAAYQRRCCSSRRLTSRLICSCRSRSGWSASC